MDSQIMSASKRSTSNCMVYVMMAPLRRELDTFTLHLLKQNQKESVRACHFSMKTC